MPHRLGRPLIQSGALETNVDRVVGLLDLDNQIDQLSRAQETRKVLPDDQLVPDPRKHHHASLRSGVRVLGAARRIDRNIYGLPYASEWLDPEIFLPEHLLTQTDGLAHELTVPRRRLPARLIPAPHPLDHFQRKQIRPRRLLGAALRLPHDWKGPPFPIS